MEFPCNVLIMGGSYGSLLAIKLLAAGHSVTLICLPAEVELFNNEGARVRMPIRGRDELVEIDSRKLPGRLSASGPAGVNPSDYDLVVLAMQEPQYRLPGVRELLDAVARAAVPCMSLMNIPPPPYLRRIPGAWSDACKRCYTDASVWESFDPRKVTLCSPDAQAFRPLNEKSNVLQVRLPTNFKAARFDSDADTALLRRLSSDIEAVRFDTGTGMIELPVKLKVHDSLFVPLAKWPMLLAGNYRCVQQDGMRPISEAVHADIDASRSVFDWVTRLCIALGAAPEDLVPFDKYSNAARLLLSPSSAGRALAAGALNIERTDCLVQTIAAERGLRNDAVDRIVELVDEWLTRNRAKST